MSALLFYLLIVASVALLEWSVMRRRYGRQSLTACVCGATIPVGIVIGIGWTVSIMIDVSYKEQPTLSEVLFFISIGSLPQIFVMTVFALIPASVTAMIYRRFRSQS